MDIDITGYRYDEDTKQLFMQRTLSSQEYELPFSQESDGTKKLIAALPVILLALREGRMVIIDELDAVPRLRQPQQRLPRRKRPRQKQRRQKPPRARQLSLNRRKQRKKRNL